MVVRKLRKGQRKSKNRYYVNVQIPEVLRDILKWQAGDRLDMNIENGKLIIEKLGVRRYGEKNYNSTVEELTPIAEP